MKELSLAMAEYVQAQKTGDIDTCVTFLHPRLVEGLGGMQKVVGLFRSIGERNPPLVKAVSQSIELESIGESRQQGDLVVALVRFRHDVIFDDQPLCRLVIPYLAVLKETQWIVLEQSTRALAAMQAWLKNIYSEVGHALQTLLWYGELAPGVYKVPHPLNGEWSWRDRITADHEDHPEPKVIEFDFTDARRTLLAFACLRWTNWPDEFEGDNLNPTPGIDPKRPYGNRTYYQLDMAEILGVPIRPDEEAPLTEQQGTGAHDAAS